MKSGIIKLFLVFGTLFLASCDRGEGNSDLEAGLPYYQFTDSEKANLVIAPKVDDQIVYKNQDGDVITFKVKGSELGKTVYSTGNFSSSSSMKHFFYDRQEISMWYVDNDLRAKSTINISKYPLGSNYNVDPPITGTPTFAGWIDFPLWNGGSYLYLDFNSVLYPMTFGGKTYSKVMVFKSNKTVVIGAENQLPIRPRNVHIVYYDYNYGIIGFDDLDGKLWRLQ